jgi:hypothetical protein
MEALVVDKFFKCLVVILLTAAPASISVQAQTVSGHASLASSEGRLVATPNSVSIVADATANQGVVNSLSSLPEADTLIYINPQRILSEVIPKLMPAKDVEEMKQGFETVKNTLGIDPTKVNYIVMAIRFKKPTADLHFQPPEVMAVASGEFSADSLMLLARMASQGKLRDETYAGKTIGLMTVDPIVKEAEKNPFLKGFTEMGVVSLNANTVAVGTPGYLRSAVDAVEGKDRINLETLNSLVRDSNALISIAGRPWHSFAKSFGMMGTEANARAARCDMKIGDFYAALTMDATNFMLRGALNEDNPDTAKIISNLFSGVLGFAANSIKDPVAQSVLRNFAITAEGDEVLLRADFPQQIVINLVQERMKRKTVDAAEVKQPAKPSGKKRRPRRRG